MWEKEREFRRSPNLPKKVGEWCSVGQYKYKIKMEAWEVKRDREGYSNMDKENRTKGSSGVQQEEATMRLTPPLVS